MESKEITAVFIGTHDCYSIRKELIEQAIICAINMGIRVFLNGGQGHFDVTCASVLRQIKKRYPSVKSYLIIPYHNFHIFNNALFDEIIYPFEEQQDTYFFYKRAISERNKVMVEWSSVAISYVHRDGGAGKTLDYAKRKNLKIIDLFAGSING